MKLRGKQSILFASSLMLCCSVARSQTSPYAEVVGQVSACKAESYGPEYGPDIKDSRTTSCSLGKASSAASADLFELGHGQKAEVTAQNGAGANARGETVQTATLKPPKGFTGKTVLVSYRNDYSWSISGVGPGTGKAESCIGFAPPGFLTCQTHTTNSSGSATTKGTTSAPKSSKGFRLSILEQAYAEAAGNKPAPPPEPAVNVSVETVAVPILTLPKGWTCKYDSGNSCP